MSVLGRDASKRVVYQNSASVCSTSRLRLEIMHGIDNQHKEVVLIYDYNRIHDY